MALTGQSYECERSVTWGEGGCCGEAQGESNWYVTQSPHGGRSRTDVACTGVENPHFKAYQVWHLVRDPQTWLLCVLVIAASVPNGAVGSFQSILIKSFGYTNKQTALLQIPGGVIAVASVLMATWSAGRFNARGINIIAWSAIGGLLGGSLLAFLPESSQAGKCRSSPPRSECETDALAVAGNYITHVVGAFLPCAYSYSAANQAGHTKKVTMNAVILMSFCLGNILGPLTFRDKDAPLYVPAKITIVAVDSVAIISTVMLLVYYKWQNEKRDRVMSAEDHNHQVDVEFADLTDRENLEFRYKY